MDSGINTAIPEVVDKTEQQWQELFAILRTEPWSNLSTFVLACESLAKGEGVYELYRLCVTPGFTTRFFELRCTNKVEVLTRLRQLIIPINERSVYMVGTVQTTLSVMIGAIRYYESGSES